LLPLIDVVKDDPFMSSPTDPNLMSPEVLEAYRKGEELVNVKVPINMVDLPLGATEDRVCGTIDIEKALTEGTKAFEPGLLAKANRGILYVDEVNLLDDHLVDVLLDSAVCRFLRSYVFYDFYSMLSIPRLHSTRHLDGTL